MSRAGESRLDLARLLALAALLFLVRLGARDLWNPNEPIYGLAVAEMAARGDWLVPTVNGTVFAEKPILYFWLGRAASAMLGGVSELALRLPAAAAGLVGVALVWLLARPYAGRRRAGIAALLFATTFVVFWSARSVQMDLLVGVAILGTLVAATRVLDHGAPRGGGWALAGAAAGLGLLAKGPVGLLCPALALGTYLLAAGRGREVRARDVAVALLAAAAVAGPWFLALAVRGERAFLHELLVRQNVTRFLAPWDHVEPWWYYLKYLWIDMAPWAFLLPLAAALPGRGEGERRLDALAWAWLVSIVVFFSLAASKRSPYILPVAPAVAVLVAGPVERLLDGTLDRARAVALRVLLGVGGAALLVGGVVAWTRALPRYPELGPAGRGFAGLLVAGGVAVLAGLVVTNRRPLVASAAFLAAVVSLYLTAAVWVLPAADAYKSARPFCAKVQALVPPDRPLRSYGFWRWRASYAYYAGRPIANIESPQELHRYWQGAEQVFLLVERARLDEVRSLVAADDVLARDEIGSNAIYLFTNRRASP